MSLKIVKGLLSDFNSNGINYCHWKSNEHLEAAVYADTDLDILFDSSQKEQVETIFLNNNFFLFEAVWYRRYKGIVDYIGFDTTSGKIVHVHTHFHLDLGEVGIKSYRLPWEEEVLKRRVFEDKFQIHKSSPEIEYLLLIVRTAFKYDEKNALTNKAVAKDFDVESHWLRERVDLNEVLALSEKLLNKEMTSRVSEIIDSQVYDNALLLDLKKQLKPFFKEYRLLSEFQVARIHYTQRYIRKFARLKRKFGIKHQWRKRHLLPSGVVISLMGSDGAGKSTQTEEVIKELRKKVDVLFMYMGSAGEMSFQRKLFDILSRLIRKFGRTKTSFFTQFGNSVKWVSIAFERKHKLKLIAKEKKRGTIIICDRYPQTAIKGYNDGPKLYENINNKNVFLRLLAKLEYRCFDYANKIPPDLVVKLLGSEALLHSRRPEMELETIIRKQKGIKELSFGDKTTVIEIDIDQEIVAIKGQILNGLNHEIKSKVFE